MRIAVNLSARQFQQKDLLKMIERCLRDTGLEARFLELEITESTAMQNTHWTIATLKALREMGISIAIDDFGTGHSSLNYLKRFAIDSVKIDQTFVMDLPDAASDAAIIAAVITMARGLQLRVIAEGVESEEQLSFLRDHRCQEMQGFLFSHPLPPAELEALLESRSRSRKSEG